MAWPAFGIAVLVILLDQTSKWWAVAELSDGTVIPVIGDLIRFVLVYNPGAAFSIGANSRCGRCRSCCQACAALPARPCSATGR